MPIIDSTTVTVGLGVAKASAAVWGLSKVSQYEAINGFPTDPNGKPYDTPYKIPGHMNTYPHQWAKHRDYHHLKPKYHTLPPGTSVNHHLTYSPPQLSVRKDKAALDAAGHPTYNGLDGGAQRLRPIFEGEDLVNALVDGKFVPRPGGYTVDKAKQSNSQRGKVGQVTGERILKHLRFGEERIAFYAKRFGLSDEEAFKMKESDWALFRLKLQPGYGLIEQKEQAGWASAFGMAANHKAFITKTEWYADREHNARDKGYTIDISSAVIGRKAGAQDLQIYNPADGVLDTTTSHLSFSLMMGGAQMTRVRTSQRSMPQFRATTIQQAILKCELLGLDWEVEAERANQWPVSRHKLYADNFQFRGNHKKRLNDVKMKRQKGGDWAVVRAREWDPTLVDHFKGKTQDELFA
eukprot:Rhum_TRINITY_DN9725_c0_g1::Rhum_TRINITY_DN9725_c0_g1_i1::g.34965::m.34965